MRRRRRLVDERHRLAASGERSSFRMSLSRQPPDDVATAEAPSGGGSVAAEEHPLLRPPQRDLPPEPVARDRYRVERRSGDTLEGDDVVRHAEAAGEGGAVAAMPVEELDHARGLAEPSDPGLDAGRVDGIEDPHPSLGAQHVRAPRQPLLLDPAEAPRRLVAERHSHTIDETTTAKTASARTLTETPASAVVRHRPWGRPCSASAPKARPKAAAAAPPTAPIGVATKARPHSAKRIERIAAIRVATGISPPRPSSAPRRSRGRRRPRTGPRQARPGTAARRAARRGRRSAGAPRASPARRAARARGRR